MPLSIGALCLYDKHGNPYNISAAIWPATYNICCTTFWPILTRHEVVTSFNITFHSHKYSATLLYLDFRFQRYLLSDRSRIAVNTRLILRFNRRPYITAALQLTSWLPTKLQIALNCVESCYVNMHISMTALYSHKRRYLRPSLTRYTNVHRIQRVVHNIRLKDVPIKYREYITALVQHWRFDNVSLSAAFSLRPMLAPVRLRTLLHGSSFPTDSHHPGAASGPSWWLTSVNVAGLQITV